MFGVEYSHAVLEEMVVSEKASSPQVRWRLLTMEVQITVVKVTGQGSGWRDQLRSWVPTEARLVKNQVEMG